MTDIPGVWAAFKDMLETVGIQVYDYVPDSTMMPCAIVYPERWPYNITEEMTWVILCLIGTGEVQGAQSTLMSWLSDEGPDSIVAAIDADSQLGGVVSGVLPLEVRNWGYPNISDGRPRYLQAELVCNVLR